VYSVSKPKNSVKAGDRASTIGGVSWTPSKYKLELSADQLTSSRFQTQLNLVSKNIDVTKFVRRGKLTIR